MDRKTRQELNELSKKVFGSSSRWQKLVDKGYTYAWVEKYTKIVPNRETKTLEEVVFQEPKQETRRHTVESVREMMEAALKDRPPQHSTPSVQSLEIPEQFKNNRATMPTEIPPGVLTEDMLESAREKMIKNGGGFVEA